MNTIRLKKCGALLTKLKKENSGILRKWFPNHEAQKRAKELEEKRKELEEARQGRAHFTSGNTYYVHETTSLRTVTHPAKDVVLLYEDSNKENRSLRLNFIQMDLAKKGVFYKGEPSDNRFHIDAGWDQAAYPQSPLAFYKDHMAAWAKESPKEVNRLVTEVKEYTKK